MSFDSRILNGLGVLAAAVDAGSFVRAGRALGLTQSGVSRAMARLEERVGVRLLQRTARSLTLTEEGSRFYEQAAPLLRALEDAANEAGSGARQPTGTIRVVASDSLVAKTLIAPGAAQFLARHPLVQLELVVRDRVADLGAEGFDLALRFGEPEPSSLIVRKLLETRVVTCAAPSYIARRGRPRHPRDLAKHECILFRDPRTGRPYEWLFQRGSESITVPVSGRLCVSDSATAIEACASGLGIAQPLELELRHRRGPKLVPLLSRWSEERFPLYVYYPSRRQPSAKVRAFLDFIVAASEAT
jgi:DNA-binding transcriptional LysR family regulator